MFTALRPHLALITVLCLQFSVCTGGVLSLSSLLTSTAFQSPAVEVADSGVYLCRTFTPAPTELSEAPVQTCETGKQCLTQAQTDFVERIGNIFASKQVVQPSLLIELLLKEPDDTNVIAQVYPPPNSSRLLAKSLIKRE